MDFLRRLFSGDNNLLDYKAVQASICLAALLMILGFYVWTDLHLARQGASLEVQQPSGQVKDVARRCDIPPGIKDILWILGAAALGSGLGTLLNNNKLVQPLPPIPGPVPKTPESGGKVEGPVG